MMTNSKMENSKIDTKLREIPKVFGDRFPSSFKNNIANWGNSSKEELHQRNEDGTYKLTHLDIDFGNTCSLKCPHCFRRDSRFDVSGEEGFLKESELIGYIAEAQKIGLKDVKFLGRGEPFENPKFLGFIETLYNMGVKSAVFTKGHVLGSDELTSKYNAQHGITTGRELAERLKQLDTSVLLGFNSFNKELQEEFIGADLSNIKDYVELRDKALLNLVDAGLNKYVPNQETRLALIAAPIKPENVDEIFDIYEWGRRRNMYVLSCPSALSGKGIDESKRAEHHGEYVSKLKDLYVKINTWNIEKGLVSLDQFEEEGVSLYPGCHPCNQVANGMYLTLSGKVVRCPGRADAQSTFVEDIRKEPSLKSVWMNSENYRRAAGTGFNYHCPARDGYTLDQKFYAEIKEKVLAEVKS